MSRPAPLRQEPRLEVGVGEELGEDPFRWREVIRNQERVESGGQMGQHGGSKSLDEIRLHLGDGFDGRVCLNVK